MMFKKNHMSLLHTYKCINMLGHEGMFKKHKIHFVLLAKFT